MAERMVQIGTAGLRSPTGEIVHNLPLYITEKDAGTINTHTGRTVAEDVALGDVAKIFADKFKQYADGQKKNKKSALEQPLNG